MIWDANFCYLKTHHLSQNTSVKLQIHNLTIKKSKHKDFKPKNYKSANKKTFALFYTNKLREISCQDKKKEYFKKKWNRKNSILAIRDNAIKDK